MSVLEWIIMINKTAQIVNLVILFVVGAVVWGFTPIGLGETLTCFRSPVFPWDGQCAFIGIPLLALLVTIYFVYGLLFLVKRKESNYLIERALKINKVSLAVFILAILTTILVVFSFPQDGVGLFISAFLTLPISVFIILVLVVVSFIMFVRGFYLK